VASDLNLYYDVRHPNRYKRPDWFAALEVPRLYKESELRMSYVIWQEGVVPFIVVELLSENTEKEELGLTLREISQPPTKWQVYERILRIPYYIVFARDPNKLRAFQLTGGRYQELTLPNQRLWLPEIKLGLGLWTGDYLGLERQWLRWYDSQENFLPTPVEKERQIAEQEKQRAEQLAAQLIALGIEPKV
jgi:Uma2 family endonuclease